MKLSVLLPVKDQSKKLVENLNGSILPYFDAAGVTYEVLICYDGSNDEQRALMEEAAKSFPSHVKLVPYMARKGKGNNVKRAMECSTGDYVLFMDADLATALDTFERVKPELGKTDCIIASRDIPGSVYAIKQPFIRRLTHWGCRMVVGGMFHMKNIKDSQCGYKCIRADLAKKYVQLSIIDAFAFDVELLYFLTCNGYSVKEVPCVWTDDPDSSVGGLGGSVMRFYKDLRRIKKNRKAYVLPKEEQPC